MNRDFQKCVDFQIANIFKIQNVRINASHHVMLDYQLKIMDPGKVINLQRRRTKKKKKTYLGL